MVQERYDLNYIFEQCLAVLTTNSVQTRRRKPNWQLERGEYVRTNTDSFIFYRLKTLLSDYHNVTYSSKSDPEPIAFLEYMEMTCVLWFTIEFLIRFLVTNDRKVFMKVGSNFKQTAQIAELAKHC